jgi:outer membrane protein OmpA-like peptidoglycan-associated protein
MFILLSTAGALSIAGNVPAPVPLEQGLTLISASSERQGDYESTLTVESMDADGAIHLTTSADLPNPEGGKAIPASFTRDVRAEDRQHARTYKYLFSAGEDEYPGTTAMGPSAAVIAELRAGGHAQITLDGRYGGAAALVSGFLALLPGNDSQRPADKYLTATGTIQAVDAKPLGYPMIVNDALVSLPAWHVKGSFTQDGAPVPIEWYISDDPTNPLTLRFAFGKDKMEITRISYPLDNPVQLLETSLADTRRAVIYGIFFDFNSATIKPRSETTLRTIVQVLNKHPDWTLNVEGHTDNIGGDARNQELSAKRAAAVRTSLIERGIAEKRLVTAGYGAAVPRDTNATLAGRARNRRVELTRQ